MSVSKWRLNKAEEQETEEASKQAQAAAIAAGESKAEAAKAGAEAKNQKATELKTAKANRAAKIKAAAKHQPTPAPSSGPAAPEPSPTPQPPGPAHNTNYYAAVIKARDVIRQDPMFATIISQCPRKISDAVAAEHCGVQSIFDPAECKTALTAQGVHRASIKLFWADILVSPTPAVPMSITRTRAWGEQFFSKGPGHLRSSIVIAVPAADADVNASKGSWQVVSPEETLHAILLCLADRIEQQAPDEELTRWKNIILSTPAQLEVISGEDAVYWASYEARQQIIQSHDSFKRTARQMCHEVVAFKHRKEAASGTALTNKQLQDLYKNRPNATSTETCSVLQTLSNFEIRIAKIFQPISNTFLHMQRQSISLAAQKLLVPKTEDIKDGFIANSVKVHDRLLCIPEVNKVLDELEARYNLSSCFNSLDKLKLIMEKCDNNSQKIWTMNAIFDQLCQGPSVLRNETVTQAWLAGTTSSASAIDLLNFRKKAAEYFLDYQFPKSGFKVEDLCELRKRLFTHEAGEAHATNFRRSVHPKPAA